MIITGRQEITIEVWIPREPITFLLMTTKPQIGMALTTGIGLAWMLRVIEN